MQLVYEDMPQESGSYQSKRICRWIYMETNITMDMGVKSVFHELRPSRDQSSPSTSLSSIQSSVSFNVRPSDI
jgi:hypothetical protein